MQANGETDTMIVLGIGLAIVVLLVTLRSIRLTQEWRRAHGLCPWTPLPLA